MKKVYICSPYRGDTETNVENARKYCRAAVELGCLPIAPHLFFPQFLDDDDITDRSRGMARAMELLSICDEVWVFGIDNLSEGMEKEVKWADSNSIPVMDGFDMISESEKRTMEDFSDQEIIDELVRRARDNRILIKARVDKDGIERMPTINHESLHRERTVDTNADCIRSMSDERLADQLVIDVNGLASCKLYLSPPTGRLYRIRTEAVKEVKEWLQQPTEEE